MSDISLIDVGTAANDGTGDDLRDAFVKVNDNFLYITTRLGENVDGENVGVSGERVFKTSVGPILQFRKIDAGENLSISTIDDVIILNFNANTTIDLNNQAIINASTITSGDITVNNIFASDEVSAQRGNFTDITGSLEGDTYGLHIGVQYGDVLGSVYSLLDGSLLVDAENGVITGLVNANVIGDVAGNLTGNVTGGIRTSISDEYVDVSDLANRINTFDYGEIRPTFTDAISYYLFMVGTDMGTFANPSIVSIDAGSF